MDKAKSALESQREMLRRAKRFADRARAVYKIDEIYVVGSRARGDYLEDSDIDLVVICDEMKGVRYIERLEKFAEFLEPGVEIIVLTREEWESSKSPYIAEMRREAKRLDELLRQLWRDLLA